jgi:hypothetical protein
VVDLTTGGEGQGVSWITVKPGLSLQVAVWPEACGTN